MQLTVLFRSVTAIEGHVFSLTRWWTIPATILQKSNSVDLSSMFCATCGTPVSALSRFCSGCGSVVSPSSTSAPHAFARQPHAAHREGMSIIKTLLFAVASLFVVSIVSIVFILVYDTTPKGKAATATREKEELTREKEEVETAAQRQVAMTRQRNEEIEQEKKQMEGLKTNALSAAALMRVYEQNEVSADNEYKGKTVVVQGRVGRIAKDILDSSYITLDEAEFSFGSVQCFFKKSDERRLATLSPGDRVYVEGTVGGKMMSVLLKDCTILD
jgi:tRNA_anti-like